IAICAPNSSVSTSVARTECNTIRVLARRRPPPGFRFASSRPRPTLFPKNTPHIHLHETHRLPLLRPLDAIAAVADALRVRCAAAIDRARRRGRGARRRRGLFPRPSLRPPARLAVPATGGLRRADDADR